MRETRASRPWVTTQETGKTHAKKIYGEDMEDLEKSLIFKRGNERDVYIISTMNNFIISTFFLSRFLFF